MSSSLINTPRISTPTLPQVPGQVAQSGVLHLPPLEDGAKLVAAYTRGRAPVVVQPGPNKSVARMLSAPFRAIRDAFARFGELIADNQAARKQQLLAKKVDAAAASFVKAFGAGTIEDKLDSTLALMKAARRLNPDKPEEAAVDALKNLPESTARELRQLSMDLHDTARLRDNGHMAAANGQVEQAYRDPKSAVRQTDAFMGALRGSHTLAEDERKDADTEKDKIRSAVCGAFGKKQAEGLDQVRDGLTSYLAGENVNTGNVLRDIKLDAADKMTRFLDANDSPACREDLVAAMLRTATLDMPLPLENATSGPKLVPSLLTHAQVGAMLTAAKSVFNQIVGDGTEASAHEAAGKLSEPAVLLLQMLDEVVGSEAKFSGDDSTRLAAFVGTLFLRHICPALTSVRINSTGNQQLQQESAVAIFLATFIQYAANQPTDGPAKLAAGMSEECRDLVKASLEECAQPLRAFKQAVMARKIEA